MAQFNIGDNVTVSEDSNGNYHVESNGETFTVDDSATISELWSAIDDAANSGGSGGGDGTGQEHQFDVPSDYATVSDAFDAVDEMYTTAGQTIRINIEAGHELQDYVSRWRSDYRNVLVRSEDDVVYLADSFPDRHVFQFENYCVAPTFRILIDGEGHTNTGFNVLFGSEIHFDDYDGTTGARNMDVGLACNQRSRVYGDNMDFSGAGYRGAMVNNSSVAMLHNTDFSGAGDYGLRTSASRVDALQGDMTNCGDNGLRANQSAMVHARAADVSNSDNLGVSLSLGAWASIEDVVAQDCGSHGVYVSASAAFVRGVTGGGNGGEDISTNNGGITFP